MCDPQSTPIQGPAPASSLPTALLPGSHSTPHQNKPVTGRTGSRRCAFTWQRPRTCFWPKARCRVYPSCEAQDLRPSSKEPCSRKVRAGTRTTQNPPETETVLARTRRGSRNLLPPNRAPSCTEPATSSRRSHRTGWHPMERRQATGASGRRSSARAAGVLGRRCPPRAGVLLEQRAAPAGETAGTPRVPTSTMPCPRRLPRCS